MADYSAPLQTRNRGRHPTPTPGSCGGRSSAPLWLHGGRPLTRILLAPWRLPERHMAILHLSRLDERAGSGGAPDGTPRGDPAVLTRDQVARLLELERALAGACTHAAIVPIVAERARILTGASAAQLAERREDGRLAVLTEPDRRRARAPRGIAPLDPLRRPGARRRPQRPAGLGRIARRGRALAGSPARRAHRRTRRRRLGVPAPPVGRRRERRPHPDLRRGAGVR